MNDINKVIEDIEKVMYSPNIIVQLIEKDVSDYDRGRVAGKLEMLSFIKSALIIEEDDEQNQDWVLFWFRAKQRADGSWNDF